MDAVLVGVVVVAADVAEPLDVSAGAVVVAVEDELRAVPFVCFVGIVALAASCPLPEPQPPASAVTHSTNRMRGIRFIAEAR